MKKIDIDFSVGKQLRLRRTMMGLSQEAIAKAVGITFQQVQKYEKGANSMNANRLYEFGQFMRVPVAYFFDDLEQMGSGPRSKDADQLEVAKSGHNSSLVSDRESLELMKAFKRIKEPVVRKRVADLVRAIADKKENVE